MRKTETDMLLINKLYDFVLWSANHIAKFPRAHKFTLGDRLATQLYDTLETLVQAKYTRDRLSMLQNANLRLELLRLEFRMAKDLRCLSLESYGYASRSVNEVGQLLGGWIKSSQPPR